MGSDGALGLQAIKAQGGLTLAQQLDSAPFGSMPHSAIATGCVDIIALPADMPAHIARRGSPHAHLPAADLAQVPADTEATRQASLAHILALLRERSRHDLSLYKPNTVMRRIERRVAVHGLGTLVAYEAFVRHNPLELDLLFAEMLIGVTAFFRDPEVWQELQDTVLPGLLAQPPPERRLRAWVAGCSTGEEAYSLAMAFTEVAEALPPSERRTLQVFATDLSADAIAIARKGFYPASIAASMTPQRLARFFKARDGGFLIDQRVREMVLFAQHDVIMDPPFTKLDILCCRNLLIYFNAALQQRLMPLLHYSLRPGGVLLLGGSETTGRSQALFTSLGSKARLYRRNPHAVHTSAVAFPLQRKQPWPAHNQEPNVSDPTSPPPNLQALADHVLLQTFSPPAVMVNALGDIVYISGRTGRYLEPAAGKANWNIHVMANPGLRTQLAVALRQTLSESRPIELQGLRLDDDAHRSVDITVQAIQNPKALEGMVMIVFREVLKPQGDATPARPSGAIDPALGEELLRSREEIRALRQEMASSQEALQATNEELQSTNEELQSTNEELTTSKEESQSMNDELQTINNELQSKLDDLALAQSDMQNLLNSTDIATLFLDEDLNVRRFTEPITRVIHLREGDIGRPLSDLASTLNYPELQADAQATLRTLATSEKQISTTDGRWFSVRIMPYRTQANVIQGTVITFVDITEAKALESRLRNS